MRFLEEKQDFSGELSGDDSLSGLEMKAVESLAPDSRATDGEGERSLVEEVAGSPAIRTVYGINPDPEGSGKNMR